MFALFVREFVLWGSRGPFTLRYSAKTHTNAWAAAMWLNYQSKFVEYADTAFILFKGSADKQLSHLHVIHHAEMGPLMYLFCSVTAGGQSAFGPMINSVVHFFMYLYYLFSNKPYVLSEGAKRAIKPCVTGLQIAQFVVILLHSTFHCLQPDRYVSEGRGGARRFPLLRHPAHAPTPHSPFPVHANLPVALYAGDCTNVADVPDAVDVFRLFCKELRRRRRRGQGEEGGGHRAQPRAERAPGRGPPKGRLKQT